MDQNLTVSTLTFTGIYSDLDVGSLRREISRGVNLPEEMTIKHQSYTDSKTKVKGTRSVLRFDRYVASALNGTPIPVSAYLVVTTPEDTGVTSADVQAVVERIVHTIQEDDSGLNLADAIFVSRQQ